MWHPSSLRLSIVIVFKARKMEKRDEFNKRRRKEKSVFKLETKDKIDEGHDIMQFYHQKTRTTNTGRQFNANNPLPKNSIYYYACS